jgi:hypothetical protein
MKNKITLEELSLLLVCVSCPPREGFRQKKEVDDVGEGVSEGLKVFWCIKKYREEQGKQA